MTDNELNALVAEKVMKHTIQWVNDVPFLSYKRGTAPGSPYVLSDGTELHSVPNYANDIAAAWQVVEKLPYYIEIGKTSDGRYFCKVNPMEVTAQAQTAPRAICLAALDAAGVTVEVRAGVSITWDISAKDHDELRSMFGV